MRAGLLLFTQSAKAEIQSPLGLVSVVCCAWLFVYLAPVWMRGDEGIYAVVACLTLIWIPFLGRRPDITSLPTLPIRPAARTAALVLGASSPGALVGAAYVLWNPSAVVPVGVALTALAAFFSLRVRATLQAVHPMTAGILFGVPTVVGLYIALQNTLNDAGIWASLIPMALWIAVAPALIRFVPSPSLPSNLSFDLTRRARVGSRAALRDMAISWADGMRLTVLPGILGAIVSGDPRVLLSFLWLSGLIRPVRSRYRQAMTGTNVPALPIAPRTRVVSWYANAVPALALGWLTTFAFYESLSVMAVVLQSSHVLSIYLAVAGFKTLWLLQQRVMALGLAVLVVIPTLFAGTAWIVEDLQEVGRILELAALTEPPGWLWALILLYPLYWAVCAVPLVWALNRHPAPTQSAFALN